MATSEVNIVRWPGDTVMKMMLVEYLFIRLLILFITVVKSRSFEPNSPIHIILKSFWDRFAIQIPIQN